jgi:hypothetical protein
MGFYRTLKAHPVALMVYGIVPGTRVLEYSPFRSAIRNKNMLFQGFDLYGQKTDIEVEKMPFLRYQVKKGLISKGAADALFRHRL